MEYTISNIMPAGETHDMYGTKYLVKFAEEADTFELWFKKTPNEGDKIPGSIQDGRFKKDKPAFGSKPAYTGPQKSGFSPAERAKSADGQHQGMCYNNAAQYVNAKATNLLPPVEWADAVYKYAQALYAKGDLTTVTEPENQQSALDALSQ